MVQTRTNPPKSCRCGEAPDTPSPCTSTARRQNPGQGARTKRKSDLAFGLAALSASHLLRPVSPAAALSSLPPELCRAGFG